MVVFTLIAGKMRRVLKEETQQEEDIGSNIQYSERHEH